MNNTNKKIALISDYFNLYLITLFIFFIKPQLFSYYPILDIIPPLIDAIVMGASQLLVLLNSLVFNNMKVKFK